MPEPSDIARLRRDRDATLAQAIAAEERVQSLAGPIAQAERSGDRRTLERLRAALAQEQAAASGARGRYADLRVRANGALGEWLEQTPETIVAALSDAHPFVLLPMRIETKFARVNLGVELRVRVFPDDIAIGAPLVALTAEERTSGEAYWRARAAASATGAGEAERAAYEGAWNALAVRSGEYRAGWIVRETQPTNWDPLPGVPGPAPSMLVFPNAPPTPTDPPVPRADALPDRFAIVLIGDGGVVHTELGKPIPDDLALGPDPTATEPWLERDPVTGRLIVAEPLKWLVDFDAAVAVGMGVRIPLNAPWDARGFDRVLAIGVRAATPATEAPALLERLLAKHRYTNGCSIVRAGTPTNNTDGAASGWQPASSESAQLFAIEDAPPVIAPQPGPLGTKDGWRLARLFGLAESFVRRLPNAAATDIAEARAMNQAAVAGTLDDFVHDFLNGLVGREHAAALHRFFVDHVSGRGAYPALRVGREPYGVVVTSAWSRWQPEKGGGDRATGVDIEGGLRMLIAAHRERFERLGRSAAHASQPTDKPFDRLLRIIGQLASSTTFASRKAVSDAYVEQRLRFGGAGREATQRWFARLIDARTASFAAAGFPAAIDAKTPLLAAIAFLRETDAWQAPIVDGDAKVPLSERDGIAPYDGTRNYLHWLATATRADLQGERFVGADGAGVPRPAALMYALLRQALLAALEYDVLGVARAKGGAFFDVLEADPLIANIGAAQHVLRRDYLEVDAARLGLSATPKTLADWVLTDAIMLPPESRPDAIRVAEARDALAALATLPTARLERVFTEHVDLCSYRLDAWITALYDARLTRMLDRRDAQEGRRGLHLGAYGWVENVRPVAPETRFAAAPESIPAALRGVANATVYEDTANAGYVHAPSLAHAVTAAVLRNAYLSHASAATPTPFAVDLSSARMRVALDLIQGVRNGQPIAALLGYQIERGLHEGHAGLELDEFIYALRDRFPLVSGLLAETPPGATVETIEARNVIHGLDLLEATATGAYPWGIAGLPAAGSAGAAAIASEIDRARDALDAVSDVLLAESVHHAAQGNFARTKASLQALTDPEAPPEPEVLRTPRSGRALAFRVALAFDPTVTAAWPGNTPRGDANPLLNAWLARHLPAPGAIGWSVKNGASAAATVTVAAVGLQPLDLVLMSGDRLGDRSSELERYLIRRARFDASVADDVATVVVPEPLPADPTKAIVFDFAGGASAHSIASLQPLLARLRRLVTRARPAHALDAWLGTEIDRLDRADRTGSASGDPLLDDFKELRDRLTAVNTSLTTARQALTTALTAIAPLRTALEADPTTIADPQWPPRLQALRQALFGLLPYGIAEALPADGHAVSRVLVDTLIGQGAAVAKLAEKRLADALALRTTTFPAPPATEPERSRELARRRDIVRQNLIEAARVLFGPNFVIVPLYKLHAVQASELANAAATPVTADAFEIEAWLHAVARVRPRVADALWALTTARWIEKPFAEPRALQLPHRPGTPWIAGPVGANLPRGDWLSIVALDGMPSAGGLQAGLVIDDWSETIPEANETTGLAFHFDRPNAVAPHAILAAVPPVLRGHWEWEDLIGAVNEALDLAKLRAVEPDALAASGYFQVLPAILSEFTRARVASVHWAERASVAMKKA